MLCNQTMKWQYLIIQLLACSFLNAQQILTPNVLQDSLYKQLELFPQEKIHLHTDRTMYIPGEKIWFKAYLVDAFSHQSPTYSQYVYVELINQSDSLVHRVMVKPDENGLFHGNIFLSEKIPDGNYTLRAYTRYMENIGDDYFFKKNIRIGNLKNNYELKITNYEKGAGGGNLTVLNSGNVRNRGDYDVSFYPEGGYIVEGVINRVAFKAVNQRGESELITGEIVDNEGNVVVTDIETVFAGMGSFSFGTAPKKEYFLVCKNSIGQEKRFPLPAARKTCVITALHRDNQFFIQLKKSPDLSQTPLYLLVHCKGKVLYYARLDERQDHILLSDSRLPAGVIQILLLDARMNPLSERLIFNKHNATAQIAFQTDKEVYGKREKVMVSIEPPITPPEEGKTPSPLERAGVRCSIAITDDADIAIDSLNTITSSLLLSSELRGYIESPGYYLQEGKEAAYALDLLMMTNGWRRYEITEAIKGNYKRPETGFETAKEISGTVKTYLTGRPVKNRDVMLVSKDQLFMQTKTDTDGKFRFDLQYPDSTTFFAMMKNQFGRENVELMLNPEIFPILKHAPVSQNLFGLRKLLSAEKETHPEDNTIDFIRKAEQRAKYDDNIKVVNLEEVVVTANRIDKRDVLRLSSNPVNAASDRTLYREDLVKIMPNPTYVADYLLLVSGVRVVYGAFGIPSGIVIAQGYALIYIDGVQSTIEDLNTLPSQVIESIDVFKYAGASIFGVRGAGGAVSITTRRGNLDDENTVSKNTVSFSPLGYQKPVEFYSPKYDTPESKDLSIPDFRTTIFWKPDVVISDSGEAHFEFYTSDFPTTYSVVIEGLTTDGKIVRQVEKIQVK